jgi:hypothetical protein
MTKAVRVLSGINPQVSNSGGHDVTFRKLTQYPHSTAVSFSYKRIKSPPSCLLYPEISQYEIPGIKNDSVVMLLARHTRNRHGSASANAIYLYTKINKTWGWLFQTKLEICVVKSEIEAYSRKHCCRRNSIIITYSECVYVRLDIQHATPLRHIVVCSL